MNLQMSKMHCFNATAIIMQESPTRIIFFSAFQWPHDVEKTIHAILAGALARFEKPVGFGHPDFEKMKLNLINTVKILSEVKVVRRWSNGIKPKTPATIAKFKCNSEGSKDITLVAPGASTGGPPVIQKLLCELPDNFTVPIVIVQHYCQRICSWFCRLAQQDLNIQRKNCRKWRTDIARKCLCCSKWISNGTQFVRKTKIDGPIEYHLNPPVSY